MDYRLNEYQGLFYRGSRFFKQVYERAEILKIPPDSMSERGTFQKISGSGRLIGFYCKIREARILDLIEGEPFKIGRDPFVTFLLTTTGTKITENKTTTR